MHILVAERNEFVFRMYSEVRTLIDPLQRQGLIKRPRAGSSPSRQILHCLSSGAGVPVLAVPKSDMSEWTRNRTCSNWHSQEGNQPSLQNVLEPPWKRCRSEYVFPSRAGRIPPFSNATTEEGTKLHGRTFSYVQRQWEESFETIWDGGWDG